MSEPLCTVMRQQRVIGWPDKLGQSPEELGRDDFDRAYVLPLSRALAREYTTDAHFAQYVTPNARRLRGEAATTLEVELPIIVLDIDCAETHGSGEATPDEWRATCRRQLTALLSAHPGGYWYETRGGARVAYKLPVPSVVACEEDARQWRQDYALTLAYLLRVFGIECDVACSDWTRLFRLPHATRSGKEPERLPRADTARPVGALWFLPDAEDHDLARELMPKAFEEARKHVSLPTTLAQATGDGLLFRLMRRNGHVIRLASQGMYVVRCPQEHLHSSGRTGDTSTVLFLPTGSQRLGNIHCKHAHCADMRPADWLRCFDDREIREESA